MSAEHTASAEFHSGKRQRLQGYVKHKVPPITSEQSRSFDFDALRDDPDLELWAFRAPHNVTSKYLKDLSLHIPVDAAGPSSMLGNPVGKISRKDKTYDIRISGNSKPLDRVPVGEAADNVVIGEELHSLKCYVPRRSKAEDRYYQVPVPIARHFVITQAAVLPTATPLDQKLDCGPPPPRRQPAHRLVHVFKPIGSVTSDAVEANRHGPAASNIDAMHLDPPTTPMGSQPSSPEKKKKNPRKAKSGEERPRKRVKEDSVGRG
ncbi:hypothetical protein FRB97_008499 [Tulasnella sp. 331]|nr:hypothetical protein FRB97_008499 [Tulasnella sp. 331]